LLVFFDDEKTTLRNKNDVKKNRLYGLWKRCRFYAKRAFLGIFLIQADFWHPLCLIISLIISWSPTNQNPWRTQDYRMYFTRVACDCEYPVIIHVFTMWIRMSTIFYTEKTWVYFTRCTRDFYMRKLFSSNQLKIHFINPGKGVWVNKKLIFDILL